jgi:hypothetical protein
MVERFTCESGQAKTAETADQIFTGSIVTTLVQTAFVVIELTVRTGVSELAHAAEKRWIAWINQANAVQTRTGPTVQIACVPSSTCVVGQQNRTD